MVLIVSIVSLFMLTAAAKESAAGKCVCHVGQEPRSYSGQQYGWLLPLQNPCECTEFRPGGVNTKQLVKPYEVTFGDDGRPTGWDDSECTKELPTMTEKITCSTYTTEKGESTLIFFKSLEVNLQCSVNPNEDEIKLTFKNVYELTECKVEISFNPHEDSSVEMGNIPKNEQTFPFFDLFDESTTLWIAYSNGNIKSGLQNQKELIDYNCTFHAKKVEEIELSSEKTTEWKLYSPCVEDDDNYSSSA